MNMHVRRSQLLSSPHFVIHTRCVMPPPPHCPIGHRAPVTSLLFLPPSSRSSSGSSSSSLVASLDAHGCIHIWSAATGSPCWEFAPTMSPPPPGPPGSTPTGRSDSRFGPGRATGKAAPHQPHRPVWRGWHGLGGLQTAAQLAEGKDRSWPRSSGGGSWQSVRGPPELSALPSPGSSGTGASPT